MVKVKCQVCGDTGYTASPRYLICECGGKFIEVPPDAQTKKVELDNKTIELFDTPQGL